MNFYYTCAGDSGCGSKGVALTPKESHLFFPAPRQAQLGARVFAITQCPKCADYSRRPISPTVINKLLEAGFKPIALPEPETDQGNMSSDEILDLYEALQAVEPHDLVA